MTLLFFSAALNTAGARESGHWIDLSSSHCLEAQIYCNNFALESKFKYDNNNNNVLVNFEVSVRREAVFFPL